MLSRSDDCDDDKLPDPGSRFASWAAGAPLTAALGLLVLFQLATWVPDYLRWPYWTDHDVFAYAARAWDLGERPYRDVRQSNFPGTTYLFYAIGKVAGWGRPGAFYAFDAGMLLTFCGLTLGWSRRRFGRILPGLVGVFVFLSYYLNLDYTLAGQRDWHAPCLVVLAIMAVQGWPGPASRLASTLLAAFALSIRPQVVLLLPALLMVVVDDGVTADRARLVRRGASWCLALAGFTALAFAPLAWAGVFDDFLRSLKLVGYGSSYSRIGPISLMKAWLAQAATVRFLVVPLALVFLGTQGDRRDWRTARAWLVALAGASLYKPLSPIPHFYLDIPPTLVWSINVAVLAAFLLGTAAPASIRLAAVIGLLGLGETTCRPNFSSPRYTLKAVESLRMGRETKEMPLGYQKGKVITAAYYPWPDYRAMLDYLRLKTGPTTRVANALRMGDVAVASVVDRPSAFPAESITWLRVVNPRDEAAFVESLERPGDTVVVWVPGESYPEPNFRLDELTAAIPRLFEFEARFGAIEVWRRRPAEAVARP